MVGAAARPLAEEPLALFAPEGGAFAARTFLAENGDVCLSVSDTGIGMTAQKVDVALSPFGQIDSKPASTRAPVSVYRFACR